MRSKKSINPNIHLEGHVQIQYTVTMRLSPLLITAFMLVSKDGSFSESKVNISWFDAQKHCQMHGSRLKAPSLETNGVFWTPLHRRYSHWMRILGCYSEENITSNITSTTEQMEQPSAGMCEEICKRNGTKYFALQNDTCKCLLSRIRTASRVRPSECGFKCNDQVDNYTFNECGGASTYNVFLSDDSKPLQMNRCVSIQCLPSSKLYQEQPCGITITKLCQNKDKSDKDRAVHWRKSMENCKMYYNSYLFGDLPLGNATVMCTTINTRLSGPTWIGIATQMYISSDQGNQIQNQSYIQSCQKCTIIDSNKRCHYTDCSENNSFDCEKVTTTTSSSTKQSETTKFTSSSTTTKPTTSSSTKQSPTTTNPVTSSSTKQSGTTEFTTSSATNIAVNATVDGHVREKLNEEGSNEHGVLVGILVTVAVLIVIGVVIGVFILKRRQIKIPKNVKQEGTKKRLPETQNKNYNESDNSMNNNYFVLEPPKSNYEVPDDSEQEPESPYNDGEEGTYDHLRDKESRRKTTDNVYQHGHYHQTDDSSDYDFAGRAQNQEIDNPYYDHANGHTRNSDYGYNTIDRS